MDKELFKQMSGDARRFQPGDRVRLVKMNDPWATAPGHTVGTVTAVAPPPVNVLCVEWDNGFGLNPCLDEDVVELEPGSRQKGASNEEDPEARNRNGDRRGVGGAGYVACGQGRLPHAVLEEVGRSA